MPLNVLLCIHDGYLLAHSQTPDSTVRIHCDLIAREKCAHLAKDAAFRQDERGDGEPF